MCTQTTYKSILLAHIRWGKCLDRRRRGIIVACLGVIFNISLYHTWATPPSPSCTSIPPIFPSVRRAYFILSPVAHFARRSAFFGRPFARRSHIFRSIVHTIVRWVGGSRPFVVLKALALRTIVQAGYNTIGKIALSSPSIDAKTFICRKNRRFRRFDSHHSIIARLEAFSIGFSTRFVQDCSRLGRNHCLIELYAPRAYIRHR